jgi:teichuronic acid biosynthesis glycosyltransferase TuaC
MRILFLCKRRYMAKDVIVDRYARLYEIPRQLANLGHQVLGLCLSYYGDEEGQWSQETDSGELRWVSRALGRTVVPGLLRYPSRALRIARDFAPDIIIGASDIPHIVLGHWIAKRLQLPVVADLYDNFESFGLARIPGSVRAFRRAVREADAVTCTSHTLAEHVRDAYRATGAVIAMPSTVDKTIFRVRDKIECRRALGLPEHAKLIGTAGGLHADKGIGTLYEAYAQLAAEDPTLHLVLAGPTDKRLPPPVGPRIHYLGCLPHQQVAMLFSALDVGVIYLRDTPFGRFCFPQKAYEMAACGIPVVAAGVGDTRQLFAEYPQCLYRPDGARQLAERIWDQLREPRIPRLQIDDWRTIVSALERRLGQIISGSRSLLINRGKVPASLVETLREPPGSP